MPKRLDLSHPAILRLFGDYKVKGRTESKSLLAWFLENYYRLEVTEVDDSICDNKFDKGIDGIYVSDLLQQVDIFQTVIGTATPVQALGDVDLKKFLGSLTQFASCASVRALAVDPNTNLELKQLLSRLDIAQKVDDGYEVRGVFITNKKRNTQATAILSVNPSLILFDSIELDKQYLPIDKAEPIADSIRFDVSNVEILKHTIDSPVKIIIAPLLAAELVKMEGIVNQELFAWNLRYQLKRSPVNKEIEKSIKEHTEHRYFPAFHNGLTILAEKVSVTERKIMRKKTVKKIRVSGYAVVNGCQSLNALYQNQQEITPDLRILTKIVNVSPKSALALKITDHTNRQNGITGRDLQSNNSIQMRLQSEIHRLYQGQVFYRIARGEHLEWDQSRVIENDAAARMLLAFDLRKPDSCHQHYKLFDDLHSDIFGRPDVSADRIVALSDLDALTRRKLKDMKQVSFAGYSLTPFLFLYLLREVLEDDTIGSEFCRNPSSFVRSPNGRSRLRQTAEPIITALMSIVDAYLKRYLEQHRFPFDHKKDLKSPSRISEIRSVVVPNYQMSKDASFTVPFSSGWERSGEVAT